MMRMQVGIGAEEEKGILKCFKYFDINAPRRNWVLCNLVSIL